ncbi:S8 family serine peptidase [Paracoccus sp. T5]|uniref:S8 family serine peptidase n=1 Tax=Paracoccus sp. T5 TaxID=3402161 RepID=UPI003AE5946D
MSEKTMFVLRAVPIDGDDTAEASTVTPMTTRGQVRGMPTRRLAPLKLEVRDETSAERHEKPHQIIGTIDDPLPLSVIEPVRLDKTRQGLGAEAKTTEAAASGQSDADATAIEAAKDRGTAWGIHALKLNSDTPYNGAGVTVAILDTGINRSHAAFAGMGDNLIEKDFTGEGNGDEHGHGTHCAGTLFGRDFDDGDGRTVRIGVAPGVERALIGKVIGGKAGLKELILALDWAFNEGADIIAMSLGFDIYKALEFKDADIPTAARLVNTFRDNVRLFDTYMQFRFAGEAMGQRALVFAATGNVSNRDQYVVSKLSPAAAIGILSVGAVGPADDDTLKIAYFSNTQPDLVGPGVGIVSAGLGERDFSVMDGTSQACPHVAGLAALHWEQAAEGLQKHERVSTQIVAAALRASAARVKAKSFPGAATDDIGAGMPGVP